ncbi:MAG: Hsp20/alpha crystallin family protein [bacterium]|nr:Hsp20/alpha crystallin family protein [bacterium]
MDKNQEDKIKELEEKIKKLEEEKKKEESGGVAGSVLRGLGKTIPGLGDIVKGLEGSEAFQERLKEIDKKVDAKMRETPLKEVRRTIIPPRTHFSAKTLAGKPFPAKGEEEKPAKRDIIVDIFDEAKQLVVIAELPGVREGDIKIKLMDNVLVISADTVSHNYYKEVSLPCRVTNKISSTYKNGILQVTLEKANA